MTDETIAANAARRAAIQTKQNDRGPAPAPESRTTASLSNPASARTIEMAQPIVGRRITGEVDHLRAQDQIAARLLARISMPAAKLDRKHIPPELLAALDEAGLGSPEALPAALLCALAMISAVAGPHIAVQPQAGKLNDEFGATSTDIGLRVCLLTEERSLSLLPAAVMGAAFGLQNDLIDQHKAKLAVAKTATAAAGRRTLHALATQTALALGHPMPPPLPDDSLDGIDAPPRLVVDDGALRAVVDASAGGTGVWLVDQRRMPNLSRVGCGDPATAGLLNGAALGQPLAAADRTSGRIAMRRLPVAVTGVLTLAECEGLQTARAEELLGTVFVAARPQGYGGDGTALLNLVRRIHELGSAPDTALQINGAAAAALGEAADRWQSSIDRRLEPITTYVRQWPSLARRLSAALHLITCIAKPKLPAEIPASAIRSAIAIIDDVVMPGARHVLGPVSAASAEESDALRLIAALRRHTSAADPVIEQREWYRGLQTTTPVPRFKAAARLLQQFNLISPAPPPDGRKGEHVASAAVLHQ